MKTIQFLFLALFCVSALAGPNPGVPTASVKESRRNKLFVAEYTVTPNILKFGDVKFPITESWLEAASEPGLLFGRKKKSGYIVVMRIEPTSGKWPHQKFTLWSPGANFGGSVGFSFFTKGPILVHSNFNDEPESPFFDIMKEPERVKIDTIQLQRK